MSTSTAPMYRYLDWLSDQYRTDIRYLGAVRIFFGIWVLLNPVRYIWVSEMPSRFFNPAPGPASLMSAPPTLHLMVGLQILQGLLAIVLIIGWHTRCISLLLSLNMILGSALVYSFGKVDHFILFELMPVAMAAAGWGRSYSVDALHEEPRPVANGFAVLLWGMVVGFAFLTAAAPKAFTGWFDPARHGVRGHLALRFADFGRPGLLGDWVMSIHSSTIWKLFDYATLALEGGLIVALLMPPIFRLWLLTIIVFHVSVYLVMGIDFSRYVLVYLPFISVVLIRILKHLTSHTSSWMGWTEARQCES